MSQPRILIILYHYFPFVGPRVIRWQAVAEQLVQQGYAVDVVCCAYHQQPEYEVINGVNIHRVRPWFFKTIYRKNILPGSQPMPAVNQARPSLGKRIKAQVAATASRLYHFFWWPDFGMFWIPPAAKKVQLLLRQAPYQRVFAVSWPVNAHAVAYRIHKDLNRMGIPLIVDIGDPFSFAEHNPPNNQRLYRVLNRAFERKLLHLASGVSVTTEPTRAAYADRLRIPLEKICVIPPINTIQYADFNHPTQQDSLQVFHLGSLRKSNRPPGRLFQLFIDLLKTGFQPSLELHLVGDTSECAQEVTQAAQALQGRLVTYGVLPHSAAIQAARNAAAFVNIGNQSEKQLPSKVIDYAASGKPIINLQLAAHDTSADFLANYPALCNLDFSRQDYQTNLQKLRGFLACLPQDVPEELTRQFLGENSVQAVTQRYLSTWWQATAP